MFKNERCTVRVGGGFEPLESYLDRVETAETDRINKLMADKGRNMDFIILELLLKYNAEQVVINKF